MRGRDRGGGRDIFQRVFSSRSIVSAGFSSSPSIALLRRKISFSTFKIILLKFMFQFSLFGFELFLLIKAFHSFPLLLLHFFFSFPSFQQRFANDFHTFSKIFSYYYFILQFSSNFKLFLITDIEENPGETRCEVVSTTFLNGSYISIRFPIMFPF